MTGFTNDALKALRRHRLAIFAVLTIGYFFVYFHRISVSVVGQDIVADVGGSIGILDGNYYLRDGSSYPSDISGSCHSHFNKGDVDFSIIENLAKDLPLSNVERPAWDVCVLRRAQWCSSVNVDFIRHSDRDNAPSESFMIVSRKVAE